MYNIMKICKTQVCVCIELTAHADATWFKIYVALLLHCWGRDALSVRLWIPEAQGLWQLSG